MRHHFKVLLIIAALFSAQNSFSQSLDGDRLWKHLEYLASDEMKGRESGTKENLLARDYIVAQFAEMGLESQYPDFIQEFRFTDRRSQKSIEGYNVVAFVPGTESKKIIVVTAHFDHVGIGKPNVQGDSIYNGSDDNASGTAALIEMARYFSENPPQHSMLFAALDAEEKGLQGARALVQDFPFELEQVLLNVNMDMISRNDKNEIYVSGTYHYPEYKDILEESAQGSNAKLMFGHDIPGTGSDDWTRSSDHGAFFEKKVPHLYFGVEDHEDYHQPSDEVRQKDRGFLLDVAELILNSLKNIDQKGSNL